MSKELVIPREEIDVIAFDWDGTVVDSVPYKLKQNQKIAEARDRSLSLEEVRKIWIESSGFTDLMETLTGLKDWDKIKALIEQDYNNPAYAKREFSFAEPAIRRARQLGFRTALLTNATQQILDMDTTSLGIDLSTYFDYIQTADDSEAKKPDPAVFTPLLHALEVIPGRIVYIGDEIKDLLAARGAGLGFIGVRSGMASKEEFIAAGVTHLVADISQITFQS